MPACNTCQDLNLRPRGHDAKFPAQLEVEIPGLLAAAEGGCQACRVLRDGVVGHTSSFEHVKSLRLNSVWPELPLVVFVHKEDGTTEYLELYSHADEPTPWPIIGAGRDVSVDSSSKECLKLAENWLLDCAMNHPKCRPVYESPLPTRVIHVGSKDQEPYLYESKGEKRKYAALSHCWGPKEIEPITTEQTTLEKREKGIPFASLSKNFQDAVMIARRLFIDYLWIDSLCIIQDSTPDWEREASQMGTVYSNAIITIAADGSPDSHGGCFVAGEGRNAVSSRVLCSSLNGNEGHIYVRPQGIRRNVNELAHTNRNLGRSKLSTRAWVLQERTLAPRTLSFTAEEMTWECATSLRCECQVAPEKASAHTFKQRYVRHGPVEDYSHMIGRGFSNSLEDSEGWKRRQREIEAGAPVLRLKWQNVVEEFTRRELTRPSDRLPAILGLASAMGRATSDLFTTNEYFFGLWRRDLVKGLLWQSIEFDGSEGRSSISRRPDKWLAPTWSWASVTGQVGWRLEVKDGDMTEPDKTGQKIRKSCQIATSGSERKGELTVLGKLTPVRLVDTKNDTATKQADGSAATVFLFASEKAADSGYRPYDKLEPDVKGNGYELTHEEKYFFLLLATVGLFGQWEGRPFGLVLRRKMGEERLFQRVGFVRGMHSKTKDWAEVGEYRALVLV
ncbi:heterokaryon incompatibility protein-domain-containing protein [Cryomyces antarcticus]